MAILRPFVDPDRVRSLWSLRLLAALALALGLTHTLDRWSVLTRIEHAWALVAALVLGHLVFAFSVCLTKLSLTQGWHSLKASFLLVYRPYGGSTIVFYLVLALAEELLFRALPLSSIAGAWWQVLGLSVVFVLIHMRRGRGAFLVLVDFFLLGLGLSCLFLWLRDLWPLVIIHWIRNVSVAKVFVRRDRLPRAEPTN